MLKAITFGALILCANIFPSRSSCALDKPTIVRNFSISISNSSTIPFNGNLYTVSKTQSNIHINSTDCNYKTCDIAIDPAKDVIQGRLEITSTEVEIFIVGIQSVNKTKINEYTTNDQYKYTVLRVDPVACCYQSISIPETNDDYRGAENLPGIVKHCSGIDLFFSSLQNCAPCRYNNLGLRDQQSNAQISREHTPSTDIYHEEHDVRFVNSMNAYFYVYHASNIIAGVELTKLKLLDSNDFKTLKERTVNFEVHAISKQKDSIGHLGVCTKTYDEFLADATFYTDVRCHKLNSNLDTTSTFVWTPTDHESRSKPLSRISYEFDKEGNSYVSFAEETELRLYIVDKDGKLIKAIDMGQVDGKFQQYPQNDGRLFGEYEYWNVNGFIVGDEYCIVTKQSSSHYSTPLQQVRCIDVKEYVNQ